MGTKRFKHLNELRAKAIAGDTVAAKALEAATYVPHHLRRIGTAIDKSLKRSGYSGTQLRPHQPVAFRDDLHITAKSHKAVRARIGDTISRDYGIDRLQMLKARREARA